MSILNFGGIMNSVETAGQLCEWQSKGEPNEVFIPFDWVLKQAAPSVWATKLMAGNFEPCSVFKAFVAGPVHQALGVDARTCESNTRNTHPELFS